jgi:hypothetical protein
MPEPGLPQNNKVGVSASTDYRILSSTWKRSKLAALQQQLRQRSHREQEPVTLLNKCNCCKKGSLVIIECFGKRGPPAEYLLAAQMSIQQKG